MLQSSRNQPRVTRIAPEHPMNPSPTPRRTTRASRRGLALGALAAAGTFVAAVAVAGLPAAPIADASASAPTTTQVVTDPTAGARIVLDTVYIVTPAPVAVPAAAPAERPTGGEEHEGDEGHEGGEEHEGGDD
jgi:hypothetical protein